MKKKHTLAQFIEHLGGSEVARRLKTFPSTISYLKLGQREISIEVLASAAAYWGTGIDLLGTLRDMRSSAFPEEQADA